MKMSYKYIVPAMLLAAATASAQENLTKEIDVEREIVPELRAASRMEIFPAVLRPSLNPVSLSTGELTEAVGYQPLIRQYEPAFGGWAAAPIPYRGYVDAGYFPVADFGVSAGYGIISNEMTSLDVKAQFLRRSYKDELDLPDFKTLDVAAGIGFSHRFSAKGKLALSTDFGWSSFNHSRMYYNPEGKVEDPDQTVLRWRLGADWTGSADNGLRYRIEAHTSLFNFGKEGAENTHIQGVGPADFSPLHQFAGGASVGASLPVSGAARFAMELTTDWQHLNHAPFIESNTFGLTTLTPYFRYSGKVLDLSVGPRIDLATGKGSKLAIAPDVNIGYNPVEQFGVWLKATGGHRLNILEELYGVSRYMTPGPGYNPSKLVVDAELGFRAGPLKGCAVTAGVAYSKADSWLMGGTDRRFDAMNLHAFKIFAALTASWRDMVRLTARYDHRLGNDIGSFWYAWRDDTRSQLSAQLAVAPIEKLEVRAGFTGRFNRSYGNIATLSAGASYRITAPLSIFADFNNILNRTQYDVLGVQTPGFNGLFGVEYKF